MDLLSISMLQLLWIRMNAHPLVEIYVELIQTHIIKIKFPAKKFLTSFKKLFIRGIHFYLEKHQTKMWHYLCSEVTFIMGLS